MTEVNPVLVRYRRDRANAFEQPGAPGVLDHLSGAREMIGELLNLNPTPPKPALSEPVELIYDGGKTKQTLLSCGRKRLQGCAHARRRGQAP